jgi:excisionase family DNA binding protein
MNLKTAARRLGVHYQTAYRWVRSGQLVAVKIGAGYEISDAALERFLARRDAMERVPAAVAALAAEASADDSTTPVAEVERLDALVRATTVDASGVIQWSTRLASRLIGDAVSVYLLDDHGCMHVAAFDHLDPQRAVVLAALSQAAEPEATMRGLQAREAIETGEAVLVPQMPQREVRELVPAEFHEALSVLGCYSALSVPIVADDVCHGALLTTRDVPGRPHTIEDRDVLSAIASRIGAALVQADRGAEAWAWRRQHTDELSAWIADDPFGRPRDWLIDAVDDDAPVAVVNLDMQVDGATTAFAALFGTTASDCKERSLADLVIDAERVADTFARMCTGEYDYATVVVESHDSGDAVVLEGAAVRLADATTACVLYLAHAVPPLPSLPRLTHTA